MYILEDSSFWNDSLRGISAFLDRVIYSLIPLVYNLIEDLAHVSILTMSEMDEFAGRIYTLLGLFMLFKVSFSIITYIINPDKTLDKQSGMQHIIKNVIIVLILIIIVPSSFKLLYDIQSAILEDQVIPKFLLGLNNNDLNSQYVFNIQPIDENNIGCDQDFLAKDAGEYVSLMVFRGFFQLDENSVSGDLSSDNYKNFEEKYCFITPYNESVDATVDVSHYVSDSDIYNAHTEEDGLFNNTGAYYVNYKIFISTAVGIAVLLLFVTMCFDVAARSVRLTFLQLISPIPIVSYIDPQSGKQGMFKKWVTEVLKTWSNLFIRLAAIFFAIYLIQELNSGYSVINNWKLKSYDWIINLFLIIGILMFAKQLPSLLEELIPGLKLGKMQLNPFKKIGDEALGGKFISRAPIAAAGIAGAGLVGGIAAGAARANTVDGNKFKKGLLGFGSGIAGGVSSAFRGGRTAFTTDKGGFGKAMQTSGRAAQGIYNREGTTFGGRNISRMQQGLGLKTKADVYDQEIKDYDKFMEISKSINEEAKNSTVGKNYEFKQNHSFDVIDATGKVQKNAGTIRAGTNVDLEIAQERQILNDKSQTAQAKANAQAKIDALEKFAKQEYINTVKANANENLTIASYMDQIEQLGASTTAGTVKASAQALSHSSNYAQTLKDEGKSVSNKKAQMTTDSRYAQAQANREYAKGQKKG